MGQADDALEKAKALTVMIDATIEGDARPGAGIIFGVANNQIYIATANHLVRRGISKASDIQVEFRWLPGQPVPAQLLKNYSEDKALDLALIVVDSAKAHMDRAEWPAQRFGDPGTLAHGTALFAIGYPNGTAYDVTSAEAGQVEAIVLNYRVPGLVPGGYSGGPLVDRNGMIVGMIRQDQPPNAEATRIDLVLNQLKAWNYKIGLPESVRPSPIAAAKQPASAAMAPPQDAFSQTLLRYVAEAPTGFGALGAQQTGHWIPSAVLPGANCSGSQHSIDCAFPSSDLPAAERIFDEVTGSARQALQGWRRQKVPGDKVHSLLKGLNFVPNSRRPTVIVFMDLFYDSSGYRVQIAVERQAP